MVCLWLEPGAAGWKVQTNPLGYAGTPSYLLMLSFKQSQQVYNLMQKLRPTQSKRFEN